MFLQVISSSKVGSQKSQLKDFFFSWTDAKCFFNWSFWAKLASQKSRSKDFFPSWTHVKPACCHRKDNARTSEPTNKSNNPYYNRNPPEKPTYDWWKDGTNMSSRKRDRAFSHTSPFSSTSNQAIGVPLPSYFVCTLTETCVNYHNLASDT